MFLFRFACPRLTRKLCRALNFAAGGNAMSRRMTAAAAAALLVVILGPAARAEQAPPGCRWQSSPGGQILACKDAEGYWRRSGDNEVVGYDPPRVRPAAPAKPASATSSAQAPSTIAPPPPPVHDAPTAPGPSELNLTQASPPVVAADEAVPPEPPVEPRPTRSPLERVLDWLLGLWWNFWTQVTALF
jgi:hypothetical protein